MILRCFIPYMCRAFVFRLVEIFLNHQKWSKFLAPLSSKFVWKLQNSNSLNIVNRRPPSYNFFNSVIMDLKSPRRKNYMMGASDRRFWGYLNFVIFIPILMMSAGHASGKVLTLFLPNVQVQILVENEIRKWEQNPRSEGRRPKYMANP